MRKSDPKESTHFRAGDRVFCLNGQWFYQTRETDHVPFKSRAAALVDLKRYVDEMEFFDTAAQADRKLKPRSDTDKYATSTLVDKDSH